MENKIIMKSIYGSHLYGTNNSNSDTDIKQIHMNPTDVLLTGKYSACFNKNTNAKSKNTADDVDFESKELRHFIKEALTGQTYAIDLIHTPRHLILESSDIWEELLEHRDKLITNNISPFIGYVTAQAAKYSDKGEKIKELDAFIEAMNAIGINGNPTMKDVLDCMDISGFKYFKVSDYIHELPRIKKRSFNIIESLTPDTRVEPYLHGPNCSFPLSRKYQEVYPVLMEKRKGYGRRAEEAAKNDGVDLKAYYHALRIIWQLEDYLNTGMMEFPSSRVHHLRDIRAGKYNKGQIENWISEEIDRVLQIPNNLPEADFEFWNEWLLDKYMVQAHEHSSMYLRSKGLLL